MMAVTKGMDSISVTLKRQFENGRYMDEEESQKETSLDTRIFSSARRVLETKIEFEAAQVQSYSVLAGLKGKYKVLSPPNKVPTSSSKMITELRADKRCESGSSPKKSSVKPSVSDPSTPQPPKVSLFPEDGVKLGWQGSEPVGAGMINLGNTCYLNSTLQALFHVPSFCNWLKTENQHNGIGKCDQAFMSGDMCLICAMASTLRISQTHTGNVMKPVLIYGRLKSICKHLSHGHQEDAHEFLRFLIEGMERCFLLRFKGKKLDNATKETTPLHRIFGGYLRNEVVCHSCGRTSTTFQLFQDLFLDIRHTDSLMDSMKAFFSRETLEGDDRNDSYRCEACKRKGNCSKRVYVQTPPKVLCFQLKRFTAMGKKIMKHISYPMKLDLSPYVYLRTVNKNGDIISPLPKVRRPIPYRLVSLVTHYGSAMTCGHYTAVGRSAKGPYFTFDDSLVRPASMNSALGACAYILMYEMEPGWNVGMGSNNGEKLVNDSLKPAKSLPELSGICRPPTSLTKSLGNLERKANSLLELQRPQHSKEIQKSVTSTAPQESNSKGGISSPSKTSIFIPAVTKHEAEASSCAGTSVQRKIALNGFVNKNIPTSKLSPSVVLFKKSVGSNTSNSPNQSQITLSTIKTTTPVNSPSEGLVKKVSESSKVKDSGSLKEQELKNSRPSLISLSDNVKQNSAPKEPRQKQFSEGLVKKVSEPSNVKDCGSLKEQESKYSLSSLISLSDNVKQKSAPKEPKQKQHSEGLVKKVSEPSKVKDSGSMKEKESNSQSTLISPSDSVKQKSAHKEPKQKPNKESVQHNEKGIAKKRKHSSTSLDDDQKSPFPLKKQLTLPDLFNRKNALRAVEIPRVKIKTLKDWLEVRSISKGDTTVDKGLPRPKVLTQVQAVKSTVGGWKVTDQSEVSSNPVSETKCNAEVPKRKKEVTAVLVENKKKKLAQDTNAQQWRTFFKNKILNSYKPDKKAGLGRKKNKLNEKSDTECAPKLQDTVGSLALFESV